MDGKEMWEKLVNEIKDRHVSIDPGVFAFATDGTQIIKICLGDDGHLVTKVIKKEDFYAVTR